MSVRILFEGESAEGYERIAAPVTTDALEAVYLAVNRTPVETKPVASDAATVRTIPPAGTIAHVSLDELEAMQKLLTAHEEEIWRSTLPELVERLLTCDIRNLALLEPINDVFKTVLEEIAFHLRDNVALDDNRLYVLELIFGKSE